MQHIVDLHTHSDASHDGKHEVKQLVKVASKAGLRAFSLTDHNSVQNIEECIKEGKKKGIEVIPGIELSAHIDGKEVHIVGLNIDYKSSLLIGHLDLINSMRSQRNMEIIRRLSEAGLTISYDLLQNRADTKEIHTQDIARLLTKQGYGKSLKDAYDKYLAKDKIGFVNKFIPSAKEVTTLIKGCEGIAVLAHAKNIIESTNKKLIIEKMERVKSEGLDGLEVYFNHNGSKFATETVLKIAAELGMLVSGGSDYHGFENCSTKMGIANNLKIDYNLLELMKKSKKWKEKKKR